MIEMQFLSHCACLMSKGLRCDNSHFLIIFDKYFGYIWEVIDRELNEFDIENNILTLVE